MRMLAIAVFIFFVFNSAAGQPPPVAWSFEAARMTPSDWMIKLSATLAPGWHIYSQHLKKGGPIPTSIALEDNNEYILLGNAVEQGDAVTYYDSLHEMKITWYSGRVNFLQRVQLNRLVPTIRGTITFMVCNEHQCIPCQESFNVNLYVPQQKP